MAFAPATPSEIDAAIAADTSTSSGRGLRTRVFTPTRVVLSCECGKALAELRGSPEGNLTHVYPLGPPNRWARAVPDPSHRVDLPTENGQPERLEQVVAAGQWARSRWVFTCPRHRPARAVTRRFDVMAERFSQAVRYGRDELTLDVDL